MTLADNVLNLVLGLSVIIAGLLLWFFLEQIKVKWYCSVGRKLGLDHENPPRGIRIPGWSVLKSWSQKGRILFHVLRGTCNGIELAAFEFHFRRSAASAGPRERLKYREPRYVVRMISRNCLWPEFTVRPESLLRKINIAFGGQDIDFPESPKFSRRFNVRSGEEARVRQVLNREVQSIFLAHGFGIVEVLGNTIFIHRSLLRTPPWRIQATIEAALELFRAMEKAAGNPAEQ